MSMSPFELVLVLAASLAACAAVDPVPTNPHGQAGVLARAELAAGDRELAVLLATVVALALLLRPVARWLRKSERAEHLSARFMAWPLWLRRVGCLVLCAAVVGAALGFWAWLAPTGRAQP
jgi:hypothetical protein